VFDQAGHIPHRTAAAAKHEDLVRIKKEQKAHLLRGPQSRTRRKWVSFGGQIRVPREIGVQSDESTGAISAAAKELDLDHEEEPASQAVTEPATATGLDLTTDEEFGHPSNDLPHPWDTNVAFRAQDDKVAVTESSTMQELDQEPDEELAYLGDDFSSYWNTNFATLNSRFDRGLDPGSIIERDNPPLVAVHAEEWARVILLVEDGKVNFLPFVAEGEHQHDWKQVWAHAMLWILHHEPHHGMRFLDITHTEPYLPRQLVADSALYLAMHFSSKSDAANCKLLAETLLVVMERPNAPRLCFDASHIRRLLRYCSPDLVLRLREGMKAHRVFVHGNTLLHLATKLSDSGHMQVAAECLLEAVNAGAKLDGDAFLSTCATILRKTSKVQDGLRLCLRLVSNLVDSGVEMNVQLCNIIMLNAVEAGDPTTAFSVYRRLLDHGLRANEYTYAILLKGCKQGGEDGELLNAVIRQAVRELDMTKAHVVAAEMLHCLYLHHIRRAPKSAYEKISDAYLHLFDAAPLVRLGILKLPRRQQQQQQQQGTELTLMAPPNDVLGIMIISFLRATQRPDSIGPAAHVKLYHTLIKIARAGEEPFASLMRQDYVFNAFLLAFSRTRGRMRYAVDVIRVMQSGSAVGGNRLDGSGRESELGLGKSVGAVLGSATAPVQSPHPDIDASTQTSSLTSSKALLPPADLDASISTSSPASSTPNPNPAVEDTTSSPPPSQSSLPNFAPPTIQTWSIFLSGFSHHGHTDLAEQVLAHMRDNGMTPNQVTWNSLLHGYAGAGDVEGAVRVLDRMEQDGVGVNEVTEKLAGEVVRGASRR